MPGCLCVCPSVRPSVYLSVCLYVFSTYNFWNTVARNSIFSTHTHTKACIKVKDVWRLMAFIMKAISTLNNKNVNLIKIFCDECVMRMIPFWLKSFLFMIIMFWLLTWFGPECDTFKSPGSRKCLHDVTFNNLTESPYRFGCTFQTFLGIPKIFLKPIDYIKTFLSIFTWRGQSSFPVIHKVDNIGI